MISFYITVTLCQEWAVPTIFHIALWEVMLMVDLGISLSQGINDTLKIIFSDSGFFSPHQDICSLILSLNIIHSLLNEIRQHSDSDPPQHRVLANSSVISQSKCQFLSSHRSLLLRPLCLHYSMSYLRLRLLVLTLTAELLLLSAFSAQACCRTMGFFF